MKKYVASNNELSDEEYYDQYYDSEEYQIDRRAEYVENIMVELQSTAGEDYADNLDKVSKIVDQMYTLASELETIIPPIIRH